MMAIVPLTVESVISLALGVLVGLVLAIPVGPTAVLCMRRTLERGPVFGFATGLGASMADAIYGAVAAFGIAAISGFIEDYDIPVRISGGLFMLVMAARLMRTHGIPKKPCEANNTGHAIGAMISGFFLTVTNPMTMIGFAAVFTSFHLRALGNADLATFLVIGVAVGSALWWLTLTIGVLRLRHRLSDRILYRINLVAGGLLALFGIFTLVRVAIKILNR